MLNFKISELELIKQILKEKLILTNSYFYADKIAQLIKKIDAKLLEME